MLKLVGSRFHFRRVVPTPLRPILGKSEIWISLGRAGKVEARRRAAELHGQMTDLFKKLYSVSGTQQPSETLTLSPSEIKEFMETYGFKTEIDVYKGLIQRYKDIIKTQEVVRKSEVRAAETTAQLKHQKNSHKTLRTFRYSYFWYL